MSSFIVRVLNEDGTPEDCFLTPQSVARFMAPPKNLVAAGQIPAWANTIVVDPYGTALPVLEAPGQIASLLAMAMQSMWFGYRYAEDGETIWMQRYDSEAAGVEISVHEGRNLGQFNG
jgi:hypothetical protein